MDIIGIHCNSLAIDSLNLTQTASDYDNGIIYDLIKALYASANPNCTAYIFTSITWGAESDTLKTNKTGEQLTICNGYKMMTTTSLISPINNFESFWRQDTTYIQLY